MNMAVKDTGQPENIAENSQLLIDFLQTEDKEELIAPLETNLDELKSKLAFRVYTTSTVF